MQWGKLITQTMQLAGRVVFIKDEAPANLNEWQNAIPKKIVSVAFTVEELKQKRFKTCPEDLIIVFPSQVNVLNDLNAILQGQRLFTGAEDEAKDQVDFLWPQASPIQWTQALEEAVKLLSNPAPIAEFSKSFESPCMF